MGQHSFKYVNPYDMEAVLIKNIIDALKDSPDPNASLSDIEGYKMSETEILWVNSLISISVRILPNKDLLILAYRMHLWI